MSAPADHRARIVSYLEREGLELVPTGSADEYRVVDKQGPGFLHGPPLFTLPVDLLDEYLHEMSGRYRDQPDPLGEALSLTQIHAMEYLTTDHGGGLNGTTALGFRRTRRAHVEFFVEQDVPPAGHVTPSRDLRWVADPPPGRDEAGQR